MKKIALCFSLLLGIGNSLYAQFPSANDLFEQVRCRTFNCYNKMVMKKGFGFLSSDINARDENGRHTAYTFMAEKLGNATYPDIRVKNISTLIMTDSCAGCGKMKSISAGVHTYSKDYYQHLLAEFENMGFKAVGKEAAHKNGVMIFYECKFHPTMRLSLLIYRPDEHGASYGFSLDESFLPG